MVPSSTNPIRPGSEEDHSTTKGNYKTDLTLTGLLMKGLGRGNCPISQGAALVARLLGQSPVI